MYMYMKKLCYIKYMIKKIHMCYRCEAKDCWLNHGHNIIYLHNYACFISEAIDTTHNTAAYKSTITKYMTMMGGQS